MLKTKRLEIAIHYFTKHLPEPATELVYSSAYELLIAVILSAQCTDKRVNSITPKLFAAYPSIAKLAAASPSDVLAIIKSISYPNSKSKYLVATAQRLEQVYQSTVPMEVKHLITLPGVGRKTANVLTSVLDNQPNMAVDTHVFRVANRIGLTHQATTPLAVEQQLTKLIPKPLIGKAHHWLILHGRYTCTARNPKCHPCGLSAACKYFKKHSVATGSL